ncbi:MAG: tripartite tricarboxylate transporter substrate binding protein [Betaproteobacteria bacterium]|nr:tripartite tricarboxylate transporter substrate binding protein [Betaproteobacteria bacterium]
MQYVNKHRRKVLIIQSVSTTRRILLSTLVIASATLSLPLVAQSAYPNRPIKLISPFPPGGTSDTLARLVASKLSDGLGQPVTVDNRIGASGNIGHEAAAKSPPDGYTLLLSNSSTTVNNPHLFKKMPFDPIGDFAAISIVASSGQVLVVHPSLPFTTLADVTAYAKANPGKLNFGSGGKGIQSHISGEMYKSAVGINIVHVPYKGGVLAVNDLLAGHIQMVFSDMAPAMPHIKAGKLRAIAVTSAQRAAVLPDVPTMIEGGLAGFESGVWWSIVAPKGTPAEIVNRINTELGKMVQQPEVREAYAKLGVNTQHSTPAKVTETIRAESPVMAKILKTAGVEAE